MNKKFKKVFWYFVLIVSIIVIITSIAFIAMHFIGKDYNGKALFPKSEQSTDSSTSRSDTTADSIDFTELKKINSDAYAWIKIPGTKIDYPVLQAGKGKNDYFYLNHNVNGDYEFSGSIYSEKQNAKDFSDAVTILYGHNMLNGTMFADLHKFESENFFKKHQYMYVYTPTRKLTYKIYAAYVYDDRHILNSFDFTDSNVVKSYFDTTLNPTTMTKNIRDGVTLDINDKILTLSTCTDLGDDTRYLVQGVLDKDELKK